MTRHRTVLGALGLLGLAAIAACRRDSPAGPSDPGPPIQTNTITITAAGASPRNAQIALGTRVLFINNDSRPHDMTSDPHPDHGNCPEINQVGVLPPGARRETGNFVEVRTCGFHDHGDPANPSLQGIITAR